jgi:hypothetical protein
MGLVGFGKTQGRFNQRTQPSDRSRIALRRGAEYFKQLIASVKAVGNLGG